MRFRVFVAITFLAGCAPAAELTDRQRAAVREEVEAALKGAYDLSKPDVFQRMMSLYPASGSIASATGGRVVTSRDTLEMGIRYFWNSVGTNMRDPQWIWDRMVVDVLSPTSAAVTATYRIPHRDPRNRPHELAGALTAVFVKRDGKWVIIQEHLSDRPAQQP